MSKLYAMASKTHTGNPVTKPLFYYQKYDDFLNHHHLSPKTILEIGTFEGESTKILSEAFPDSQILSLDLNIRPIDFTAYKNVTYKKANQIEQSQLLPIITQTFPEGVDLVIEDASHYGFFSKLTFDIVFPLVKSDGAYFIEDWGTGYWDSWPDGSRFQNFPQLPHNNSLPKRIPSHDFGMVGFVKSLVDLTHESAIKNNQGDESRFSSRVKVLEFGEGVCMLLKT
ncbi:MAG: hypothetical protein AB7S86_00715 [Hydrogenophaga sp.]|uniref:hypothetical protein n=1 Tax=Hydrogenophaga sp. TaxID=1904254 RepID=UPI003D1311E1